MTDDSIKRLLRIARRVAQGQDVDWDRELSQPGDRLSTLRGLSRLATVRAGFVQALESPGPPDAEHPETTPDSVPFQWGHLQVRERLGGGSFAEVYRAYDPLLDSEVALKLVHPQVRKSRAWLEEARRLARVRHPNVVVIHGVDVHDDRPGIWTDLVCGATLEARLCESGPVAVEEACHIGIELCRALAAVHAAGIVHGDIKAANVLREVGGRVVLTDFGAATDPGTGPASVGTATPLSMAPELFDGLPPSPASDVYSLGVLLHLLVTGCYPVQAESLDELRAHHARALQRARPETQAELPSGFREALNQALSPNPDARVGTAREMERLLIAALTTSHMRGGQDSSPVMATAKRDFPYTDRLLGREAEMGSLRAEFQRGLIGTGYPMIVHGDPGVGKTFLARHFQRWAEAQGALVLYGRFYEEDAELRPPYQIFIDLLSAAGVRESSLPEDSGLEEQNDVESRAAWLPQSIGQAFVRLGRSGPLVLIFDDLQWATESGREVIGYLMRCSEGESLMLLASSRSEALDRADHPAARWLGRLAAYRRFTTMRLEPFDQARFGAVLEALVPGPAGTSDIPEAETARLYRLSGGNPYFLVELLRLLAVSGSLVWEEQPVPGWRWRGSGAWRLPDSLVMATRDRLAALSQPALEALQAAAVLGDEFQLATVERVLELDRPDLEFHFEEATRSELLSRRGLAPGSDYAFRHSLVRQVIIEDLSPGHRRGLHAAAAKALRASSHAGHASLAVALSWHYEAAGDPDETFSWSLTAWQEARRHGQWSEALTLIERAGEALNSTGETERTLRLRLQLLLGEAEAAWHLGRLERSRDCADRAVQLARSSGDPSIEAQALLQQARTGIALGRYHLAERAALAAAERYRQLEDHEGVIQARLQVVAAGIALGSYGAAASMVRLLMRTCRSPASLDAARGLLGWALALQGRFSEALPLLKTAVEGAERLGDMRELAIRLRWLHWVHLSIGEFEDAFELARQAYDRARRVDDRYDEAKAIMGMGQARLGQGLHGEAVAYLRRTLEKLHQMGAPHREAETLWLLGRANGERGRIEAARSLLNRALNLVREIGDRDDEFRFLADLAQVELAAGHGTAALESATRAVAIAVELEAVDGLGICRVARANALNALGCANEAVEEARAAVALLDRTGSAERWRAYWALARALQRVADDREKHESAVTALYRAVGLLQAIRDQVPADDHLRHREMTLLRSGPARELVELLDHLGRADDAARVARAWEIPA